MANNLDLDVTAKTQAARDELQLLNAQIRATTSEVKKLATEANKDPLAIPKFRAANLELTKLKVTADGLNKTIHRGKEEAEGLFQSILHLAHGNRPVARLVREFGSLGGSIENTAVIFGRFAGGFAGGAVALAAFKGFELLKDAVLEANKALLEWKKTAGTIGVRPVAVQAVQEAAKEAGHDVEEATKIYEGFGKIIEENRNKFGAPAIGGAGLPTVLQGGTLGTPMPGRIGMPSGTMRVGRGGQPGLTDPTKALDDLDLRLFEKTEEGVEKAARALQQRLLELQKTMNSVDFNIFAKAKFGVSGEALGETIHDIDKLEELIKKLQASARGATKEHIAQVTALAAAQGKLATSRKEAFAPAIGFFNQTDIAITEALTRFFNTPWGTIISDEFAKIPGNIQRNLIDPVAQDWTNFVSGLTSTWTGFCDGIVSAVQTAAATIQSIWGGIKGAAAGAGASIAAAAQRGAVPGLASGGYVRGPGSGTSDSILARLSAGEFVINSASVRRLGAGFLSGLNGFADGGLVGFPRFAAGGLVPGVGGGTPVHLHLDGQSFATSAESGVAQALVVAARRQQMRSAGVKPSWYGGRPGA